MQQSIKNIKIAFQGDVGSYSHQAAEIFADQMQAEFVPIACGSFSEVFEKVSQSIDTFGSIPLENSSMGTIVANYDLFWESNAKLIREFYLPIHHNLIGLSQTKLESITQVISHPAALEQCCKLFRAYPNMKPINHWDTSASVKLVYEKNDPAIAAIGSAKAAQEHKLTILKPSIEDFEHNATRFGLIANGKLEAPYSMPCKMSIAVELPHKQGTLGKLLTEISNLNINLTKCESRPIPENAWHYRFFLDLEITQPKQNEQICELISNTAQQHKLLGCYTIYFDSM